MIYCTTPQLTYKPDSLTWLLDPKYDTAEGVYNQDLADWSKQFCVGGVALDLNAGYGEISLSLADAASKVIAIEPNLDVYYALCGNIFLNNKCGKITAYNLLTDSTLETIASEIKFIHGRIESFHQLDGILNSVTPTLLVYGEKDTVISTLKPYPYDIIAVTDCPNFWLGSARKK